MSKGQVMIKSRKLSASLEDYLEAIFNLAEKTGIARSRDIADMLCVSRASVTGALHTLKKKGLVHYAPYDFVTLTKSGQAAAAEVARRHEILKSFFANILGVKADIAQKAACKAEHLLGPEVISRLMCFSEFVTRRGKGGRDMVNGFEQFYKSREIKV